uniref:Endonuclease/exonuclease/phosphatase n=2 Tax=Quercus lobata TaxID=97700 RepID=A0A7N2KVG6_QUELO
MLLGDCNSYSSSSEKCGGSSRGDYSSKPFRNFLSNAAAIELGFHGPQYTCVGCRSDGVHVRIRLDQGCCNQEWQEMFPNAGIKHLVGPTSDHKPILLDTHFENNNINKPFRFEAMLLASKWNKTSFGQTKTKIQELERRIEAIQSKPPSKEALEEEASLMMELKEWQTREELRLKQKSCELWLKEGDKNSKFFHASILIRRRRNNISEIKLENGERIYGREDIEKYFEDHFNELYSTSNPSFPVDLENLIELSISAVENTSCSKSLQKKKFKELSLR